MDCFTDVVLPDIGMKFTGGQAQLSEQLMDIKDALVLLPHVLYDQFLAQPIFCLILKQLLQLSIILSHHVISFNFGILDIVCDHVELPQTKNTLGLLDTHLTACNKHAAQLFGFIFAICKLRFLSLLLLLTKEIVPRQLDQDPLNGACEDCGSICLLHSDDTFHSELKFRHLFVALACLPQKPQHGFFGPCLAIINCYLSNKSKI